MMHRSDEKAAASPGSDRYLVFTAFVSGAVVMVIEILGSRVIGPPFGVSLFVWTSLITVTLVSLALGYWIGGRVSDAKDTPGALFTIILISGIFILIIPLTKAPVINASISLGLRAGSLVSSAVLFGPPLFFLGMVTPFTVKLYMKESEGLGKTVGWLYAVSTCGSFLGTVFTGFLLIPNLGVNNIIYLSSFVLISTSAFYWLAFRRKARYMALLALPVALALLPKGLPSVTRPDGTKVSVVHERETPYGQIKVVDYSYGDLRHREFLLDNIVQGAIDVGSGRSTSPYTYYIERLARGYGKGAETALVIGLGSGMIPKTFAGYYNIKTDVVEINKDVIDAASRYFAFDPSKHKIHILDGRYFLRSGSALYDIIVLDAFAGDTPPSHLISLEAFQSARKRLSDDGVLLMNFVGSNQRSDSAVLSSVYKTLKAVFPSVDVYASGRYASPAPIVTNFIFTASNKEKALFQESAYPPVYPALYDDVNGIFYRKVPFEKGPFLFTDDYNPIDFQDLKTREAFRYITILTADRDIVVN